MEVSVVKVPVHLRSSAADPLLMATPAWCLVERDSDALYLVKGLDLAEWLREHPPGEEAMDLTEVSIRRWTISTVPVQATLRQALDSMRSNTAEAACIYARNASGKPVLQGIVTRETIEKFSLSGLG